MVAATREVINQGIEHFARAGATDDGHVVIDSNVAAVLSRAQTGTVVGRVRVILPTAAIRIDLRCSIWIRPAICGIGTRDRVDLEDGIREVDVALDLFVPIRSRRADQLDIVGFPQHKRHRPAGGDRHGI